LCGLAVSPIQTETAPRSRRTIHCIEVAKRPL
jgi:hypothetical protein